MAGSENYATSDDLQKRLKKTRTVAIVLGVIAVLAIGAVIGLLVYQLEFDDDDDDNSASVCGTLPEDIADAREQDRLGDPETEDDLHVFHSLTVAEIKAVRDYLATSINLTRPSEDDNLAMARVHAMDVELPSKADVLNHLDNKGTKPDRRARVYINRGDLDPPILQELVCGPLPDITSCRVDKEVPFSLRVVDSIDYRMMERHLIPEIQCQFGFILRDSFNGSFDYDTCEDDCLNYWETPIGSGLYGLTPFRRRVWILPMFDLPYYAMFPVDMGFQVDIDGVNETEWKVLKVWYAGNLYRNPDDFVDAYIKDTIPKTKYPYFTGQDAEYATVNSRMSEEEKKKKHQRPPQLIEPDGKRYTVKYGKIEYLNNMWSFYYRVDPMHGPALYDIKFKGERIAYELSLMEIAVQYSGYNPMTSQCLYIDTAYNQGTSSKAVFPGADCPSTATLLPFVASAQDNYEPAVFTQGTCVFEENTGRPIRRHHSYSEGSGWFYGGMLDAALTVRTIPVVDNYDYVIDFTFHQNGAIEVRVGKTGYIMTSAYTDQEKLYGSELYKQIYGPLHNHWMHFKVDMDIQGTSNRYATLDLLEETKTVIQSEGRNMSSTKLVTSMKTTEKEGNFKFDFDRPKFHVIYNDKEKNEFGDHKAYRIHPMGIAPSIIKQDVGNERSLAWSRYQLSVTKQKDSEARSSAPYNMWETENPPVDFTKFYDDDESIVDQDVVTWVTLGSAHPTRTEDLPLTSTPGADDFFHIIPFNYFAECPTMTSPDVFFAEVTSSEGDVNMELSGAGDVEDPETFAVCQTNMVNYSDIYNADPDAVFEVNEDKGVY